jgi:hypothetical protein
VNAVTYSREIEAALPIAIRKLLWRDGTAPVFDGGRYGAADTAYAISGNPPFTDLAAERRMDWVCGRFAGTVMRLRTRPCWHSCVQIGSWSGRSEGGTLT